MLSIIKPGKMSNFPELFCAPHKHTMLLKIQNQRAAKIKSMLIFSYVAEVNQKLCLRESGQWLENVDQSHLVLASGKLVLQKCMLTFSHSHEVWQELLWASMVRLLK